MLNKSVTKLLYGLLEILPLFFFYHQKVGHEEAHRRKQSQTISALVGQKKENFPDCIDGWKGLNEPTLGGKVPALWTDPTQ